MVFGVSQRVVGAGKDPSCAQGAATAAAAPALEATCVKGSRAGPCGVVSRAPKGHISIGISHSGSKAQYSGVYL